MLSRGEESCGEVGLNSGFSGFFMVGEDMSACGGKTQKSESFQLPVLLNERKQVCLVEQNLIS